MTHKQTRGGSSSERCYGRTTLHAKRRCAGGGSGSGRQLVDGSTVDLPFCNQREEGKRRHADEQTQDAEHLRDGTRTCGRVKEWVMIQYTPMIVTLGSGWGTSEPGMRDEQRQARGLTWGTAGIECSCNGGGVAVGGHADGVRVATPADTAIKRHGEQE